MIELHYLSDSEFQWAGYSTKKALNNNVTLIPVRPLIESPFPESVKQITEFEAIQM